VGGDKDHICSVVLVPSFCTVCSCLDHGTIPTAHGEVLSSHPEEIESPGDDPTLYYSDFLSTFAPHGDI
jgi:hypothetical protein